MASLWSRSLGTGTRTSTRCAPTSRHRSLSRTCRCVRRAPGTHCAWTAANYCGHLHAAAQIKGFLNTELAETLAKEFPKFATDGIWDR